MPKPQLLGPTLSEAFRNSRGAITRNLRTRNLLERVAEEGGTEVDRERLANLERDIASLEERAARNKRGLSRRSQERLERARRDRDNILEGRANAPELIRSVDRKLEQDRTRRARERAAKKAGNPPAKAPAPRKAAKKTTTKAAKETTKKATTKTTKKATGTTSSRAPRKKAT